jgi:UDP-glucose 4-epimerase
MTHALVTGASGLLGSFVCKRLAQMGVKVTALINSQSCTKYSNILCLPVDLASEDFARKCPTDVDVVIHLAQSSQFRDFPGSALDVFNVNVASTARLLDFAKQVGSQQFIYASSGGVYGFGSQAFAENHPILSLSRLGYYLGSKACGEILVQSYASIFQVTVVRPFFIYGPGQNRGMLVPRLFDSVASAKPISLQGSDGIRINPVHAMDAASAVVAALNTQASATVNIAGPQVISIREIAEMMGQYLDKKPVFNQIAGEPRDLIADISVMRKNLFEPRLHLLESLAEIQP